LLDNWAMPELIWQTHLLTKLVRCSHAIYKLSFKENAIIPKKFPS
jgi:hypothetical protein